MRLLHHHEHILRFLSRRQRPATTEQIATDMVDSKHAYSTGAYAFDDVSKGLDMWLSQLRSAKLIDEPTEGFFEITTKGDAEVHP